MLGRNARKVHIQQFTLCHTGQHFAHIRSAMVEGLNQFHAETLSGEFPTSEYCFNKQVEIPPAADR